VGTAKLELVPPVKTPLAGYSGRRGKPAVGVHDPPFVRAIVMRGGGTMVALASCDLLIIDERLFEAVRERLSAAGHEAPMGLLVAATHTHSGPGAYGQKFLEKLSMGHFDPAVFEFLTERIVQAVETASGRLQPVTVRYAAASAEGLVVNRMDHQGVVDSEVAVLAFDDPRRQPLAVLVNFSAHPTTLGAWNQQMSADYPGALAQAIERRYPSAICLFFAGAVGDQGPMKHGEAFERPQRLGEQLAAHVAKLLEGAQQEHASMLAVAQRTVRLPPASLRIGPLRLPGWLARSLVDDDASLTLAAVNGAILIGLPCDMSAELGLELKRHARTLGLHPFLIGFANDYVGYCLPERLYGTNSYEASMAFNGPTTGTLLVEELKRMMDELIGQP
jgi:hypothetical protein